MISSGMISENFDNEVHFQLIQSQNLLPCDELSTFVFPNQEHLPLPPNDHFESLIPMLLHGYCFCNQGVICLQYLSLNLVIIFSLLTFLIPFQVFKCSWIEVKTTESDTKFIIVGKTNRIHKYSVSLQLPQDILEEMPTEVSSPPPVPSFLSLAQETIFQIASITCFQPTKWIGSHTILLSSEPGSGKTTLLSNIDSSMKRKKPSAVLSSIFLSGTQLTSRNTQTSDDVNHETSKDFTLQTMTTSFSFLMSFIDLICSLVSSFSPTPEQQNSLLEWMELCQQSISDSNEGEVIPSHLPPLLLIIDNIDLLLASPQVATIESNLISRSLVKLLNVMSQSSFSYPVCLIASTSISQSLIPTQFHGSPGFETIVTLPLPQAHDREVILQNLFRSLTDEFIQRFPEVTSTKIFELIDRNDENEDSFETNLVHWISRGSALTSGYLPGDLVKIIRRMGTISFGKCSRQLNQSLCLNLKSYIHWEDFLNALNMTPPHQLLNLQDELFQDGGLRGGIIVEGRSSSLLSWNDFAGYEKEKFYIQNILNRFSVGTETSQLWNVQECVGFPKGLLICGESGSGKSYLAKIIAAEVDSIEIILLL
jgi:hypothetical protein